MRRPRSAYEAAVQYLSRRNHSRFELDRKLRRRFDTDEIQDALDRLVRLKYLDDCQFAVQRGLANRNRKGWGNLRISRDLQRLGIGDTDRNRAMSRIEKEAPQAERLVAVMERWVETRGRPTALGQLKKLHDRCLRLGYPASLVRQNLDPYFRILNEQDSEIE